MFLLLYGVFGHIVLVKLGILGAIALVDLCDIFVAVDNDALVLLGAEDIYGNI